MSGKPFTSSVAVAVARVRMSPEALKKIRLGQLDKGDPIAAAVMWMGVYPESFLAPMRADIAVLDARLAAAAPAGDAKLAPGAPRAAAANAMPHHEGSETSSAKEGAH